MRGLSILALILSVTVVSIAQLPKQKASNKTNAQTQVKKSPVEKATSDTPQPNSVSETQFYTYNHEESERAETVKIVSDVLLAAFTLALVFVGIMQFCAL